MSKKFIRCAGIRAVKTICQTALGIIGTSVYMHEINWIAVLSASLVAGIASILTSIVTGLPEAEE